MERALPSAMIFIGNHPKHITCQFYMSDDAGWTSCKIYLETKKKSRSRSFIYLMQTNVQLQNEFIQSMEQELVSVVQVVLLRKMCMYFSQNVNGLWMIAHCHCHAELFWDVKREIVKRAESCLNIDM